MEPTKTLRAWFKKEKLSYILQLVAKIDVASFYFPVVFPKMYLLERG